MRGGVTGSPGLFESLRYTSESCSRSSGEEMKTVFDQVNDRYKARKKELKAQEKAERQRSRKWLWLLAAVILVIIIVYLRSK